ncbi:MAG: hypothetical protein ABSA46_14735 [Thermodesulfovibrionales bacterium]
MAEIGKIERPSLESFVGKRKLYCVPSVYPFEGASEDYQGLVDRFWDEVSRHLERIEAAGRIGKIFCEHVSSEGEGALAALAGVNSLALNVVRKKIEEGAVFIRTEDEEILGPFLDWGNCLQMVRTNEVFTEILEFYSQLSDRRLRFIGQVISTNLSEGEAGLLIMRDEDRMKLQLPEDIEIFLVVPPSYDDILRWLRARMRGKEDEGTDSH